MAIGDKQVLNSQVADGSSDYLIPGAVSLQLKAVQALFEDNSAGSDWLPAVVAISDSGHVLWRAVDQGVKVTAGADAEVSWFPGVKHAAAASVAATGLKAAHVQSAALVLAAGASAQPSWNFIETNAPSLFTLPGAHPTWVGIADGGVYRILVFFDFVGSPITLTGVLTFGCGILDNANNPVDGIWGDPIDIRDATVADPKEVSGVQGFALQNTFPASPAPFHLSGTVFTETALTVQSVGLYITQDSTVPLT